jgi:HEAT repeat protein
MPWPPVLTPSPLPRTLAAALRDVGHKKLEVRLSALADLARIARQGGAERPQALRALARALAGDATAAVRSQAAVMLADADASECIEELCAATRDENQRVCQMALMALGEVASDRHEEAGRVVERALVAEEPELRFQALVALHHIACERAWPALRRALEDDDAHIRYVALRIAEEHCTERSGDELPEDVRELARSALADPASEVRLAAAILLARMGDRSGQEVIVAAVETGSGMREPEDAQAAIELCGELGLEQARPALARRAFGLFGLSRDPFAWQARVALARLGDERAKAGILRGLMAWTRDTRTLAVAAAGSARLAEARPLLEAMRDQPERAEPAAVEEALAALASHGS